MEPFRDLVQLLLTSTILAPADPGVRLYFPGTDRKEGVLGGATGSPLRPMRLTNGYYLRITMSLAIEQTDKGPRLKTRKSSIQYQAEAQPGTDEWLFRYDYLRDQATSGPHPQAHVQIKGSADVPGMLPADRRLERIHFPTRRMPLEGVIRLLAEERQFAVPTREPRDVWRAMLAASESAFIEIAHEADLGPSE